jgi:hypothetical protein
MGSALHKGSEQPPLPPSSKLVPDIYSNFTIGNQVIMHSLRKRTPPARRIKHIETVLSQLLDPFLRTERYVWGREIAEWFSRCFLEDFEVVWSANREQFYELLLRNCRVELKDTDGKTYQEFFYAEAIDRLE